MHIIALLYRRICTAEDTYATRVQEKVRIAKLSSELRREFMNWEMTLQVERNKGKAEGRAEGDTLRLIRQIQKKVQKNKSLIDIIADLESNEATICPIYKAVKNAPASSTPEQILDMLTVK